MKNRATKLREYNIKYSHLPNTKDELVEYIKKKYNFNHIEDDIIDKLENNSNTIQIVLFEVPEGSKRPRARLLNRSNVASSAISDSKYIHIYSPNASADRIYMERLLSDDIIKISEKILTPCDVEINAYFKTPSSFNKSETLFAELGYIRPITTPDWDNIGKKYCDMFNSLVWLDDRLCISGTVNKLYSIKPRIEINLKYYDKIFTKKQAKSIAKSANIDLNELKYLF